MAATTVEQAPKQLALAEPVKAPKWDVEAPIKPAPADASSTADAASDRRKRAVKIALGVGTGILVALFIALTIALAVTYTRDCGNKGGSAAPVTTDPGVGGQASSSSSSSQQQTGSDDSTAKPNKGDVDKEASRISRFRQGPDNVAVTPLTAAVVRELGVESWPATITQAMTTLNAKWDKDHDVYIKSGKVMVTWFVKIENLGGSPASSVAETAIVEAGQVITVPAGVKTTWNYILTTEELTKVYA